jgi:hypothetical protein
VVAGIVTTGPLPEQTSDDAAVLLPTAPPALAPPVGVLVLPPLPAVLPAAALVLPPLLPAAALVLPPLPAVLPAAVASVPPSPPVPPLPPVAAPGRSPADDVSQPTSKMTAANPLKPKCARFMHSLPSRSLTVQCMKGQLFLSPMNAVDDFRTFASFESAFTSTTLPLEEHGSFLGPRSKAWRPRPYDEG